MSDENPYSPPQTDLNGPSGVPTGQSGGDGASGPEAEPADRMVRLLGAFIDAILLMIFVVPAMWFGGYIESAMSGSVGLGQIILWTAISFGIFVLQQAYPLYVRGQTWAKWLLDIRIVDLEGRQPEFWRLIVLRYLVPQILQSVPIAGGAFTMANALFIFGEQRRCLHDYIAGTRVINVQRR